MQTNNIVSGIGYGGLALLLGIERGISGIVLLPYRGAKNEGVLGFGKGVIKGKKIYSFN